MTERTEPNPRSPNTSSSILRFIIIFNILRYYINLIYKTLAPREKIYLAELPPETT